MNDVLTAPRAETSNDTYGDGQPTMFGGVIRLLHGDRQLNLDETLYRLATDIRDAWPTLDQYERMTVDTMLACTVLRANLEGPCPAQLYPSLFADAHGRSQSGFAMRSPDVRALSGTADEQVGIIRAKLGQFAEARSIVEDGTADARIRATMELLRPRFPDLNLSFGYVGNCSFGGPRGYDDRSWKVFTTLATPRCLNACDVSFGGQPTAYLGKLVQLVESDLEPWCVEQQRRLDAGEIRQVKGS